MLGLLQIFKSLTLGKKILVGVTGVAILTSLLLSPYFYGKKIGSQQTAAKFQIALAQASLEEQKRAREQEKLWQKKVTQVTEKYQAQEIANAKLKQDLLDSLKSGNLRLRAKFTCKVPGSLPPTARNPGESAGSPSGIFSTEDQEFLIRIGAEADGVVNKLKECVDILQSWPRS